MEPCAQAVTIAKIETTLGNVVTLLEKHEEREDRMISAMEAVAGQAESIRAIHESLTRHEKEIDNLYIIYRKQLEEDVKDNIPTQIMKGNGGWYVLGGLVFVLLVEIIAHKDIATLVYNWFK